MNTENKEVRIDIVKLESPADFFINYVRDRNIDIITKSEWESLYFYSTIKYTFPGKSLVSLKTEDLYQLTDILNLDFAKVTSLLKKCYRFERDTLKQKKFKELLDDSSVLTPICEGENIKFSIINSLVQERVEEIMNMSGVFSDTSFKKNIFTVPCKQFLRLIEVEDQSLITKLGKIPEKIEESFKKIRGKDESGKLADIQSMINNKSIKDSCKTLVALAEKIAEVNSLPINTAAKAIIGALSSNKNNVCNKIDFSGIIA